MMYSEEVKKENLKRIAEIHETIKELIKQERLDEALSICRRKKLKDNKIIQTKRISILIAKANEESLCEALKICNRKEFEDDEIIRKKKKYIQSKRIKILMAKSNEESLDEALGICRSKEFRDNEVIQTQRVNILTTRSDEESLGEALSICRKKEFKDNKIMKVQRIKILITKGDKESLDEALKICNSKEFENDEMIQKKKKYIQSKRVNILIKKGDEKSLKEALNICNSKEFEGNEVIQDQKDKVEKDLERVRLAKTIFEARMIDENTDTKEKKSQTVMQKQERMENVIPQMKMVQECGEVSNCKSKEQTIHQIFENELATLKANILLEESRIDYGDNRLKVPINASKYYHVPSETLQELTQKFEERKLLMRDLDMIEIVAEKPMSNLRAKMQLVLLFRKYGMQESADENLKVESEIYDHIYDNTIYKNVNKIIFRQSQLKRIKAIQERQKKINPEYDKSKFVEFIENDISEMTKNIKDKIVELDYGNR